MSILPRVLAACCAFGIGCSVPARADDGAMDAVGGTLALMRGHRSVRLVYEEVRVRLPQQTVHARFVLRNEGPATTVLIGFPEEGGGADYSEPQWTAFKRFRSYVDGRRVHVTRRAAHRSKDGYEYWWVKRVRFGRGQTRTIVNRYTGGGYWNSHGQAGFTYILKSGASWKGPIGRARIICDIRDLREYGPVIFAPRGYRRHGHLVTWDLRKFEPEAEQNIDVHWVPAFVNVWVNGNPVPDYNGGSIKWQRHTLGPRRFGNDLWIDVHTAADWLGGRVRVQQPKRAVSIIRGKRWVAVRAGSPWLRTPAGRVRMRRAAAFESDSTRTPLLPLVRAFGGSAAFDRAGRLRIRLPTAVRARSAARRAGAAPGAGGSRVGSPDQAKAVIAPPASLSNREGVLAASGAL